MKTNTTLREMFAGWNRRADGLPSDEEIEVIRNDVRLDLEARVKELERIAELTSNDVMHESTKGNFFCLNWREDYPEDDPNDYICAEHCLPCLAKKALSKESK